MFNKIKALFLKTKVKGYLSDYAHGPHAGMAGLFSFGDGAYDNVFADVSRIAEQFSTVLPYAIDASGNTVSGSALIAALYNPNKEMSGPDFFEALATMALVHPFVYILCHRKDGKRGVITRDNIGGFTFLENPTVKIIDGVITYKTKSEIYTDKEVIAISLNFNPYRLLDGYSPTEAAKKWATLDDYIVDWQSGFFRNNAIPAGMFVVTAKNPAEFNKTVDKLEAHHKGAGRNNNVTYVHRPTSEIDGKPVNAQIEWVPFNTSNKDLKLDQVFDQANKKTSMAYGTPEEIKGHLQNSNYASVTVAEHVFEKYTVLPKLTKVWAKFTHEMNRITGGLGYAITFDYEPASLADEEKVRAEATKIQFETLSLALAKGFDLKSAVFALNLPEDFAKLEEKQKPVETNPEVASDGSSEVSQTETSLKSVKTKKKDAVSDDEVEALLEEYTEEQIEAFIDGEEFDKEKKSKELAEKLLPILIAGALVYVLTRKHELETSAIEADYEVDQEFKYEATEEFKSSYLEYLEDVAFSFTEDTDADLHKILERAETEELSELETNEALRDLLNDDMWRIRRLQDTEAHRSSELESLDMAREVARHNNLEDVVKVWNLNHGSLNHCALCEALDGKELLLEESFDELAQSEELGKFSAGKEEVADAHPHCHCYLTYKVPEKRKEEEKSVKVTCPKCKRYICEAKSADLQNVVCPRCGTHFDKKVGDK